MWYVLLFLPSVYAFDFESIGCYWTWNPHGWVCESVDFTNVDLTDVDLTGALLSRVRGKLEVCPSDFVDMNGASWVCRGKYLIGPEADLSDADLTGADLMNIDFTEIDLKDADLTDADLTGVKGKLAACPPDFVDKWGHTWTCRKEYLLGPEADLSDADLTGADLTGADLSGVDLTGVDLTGAKLFGVIQPDSWGVFNIGKANIGCAYGKLYDSNGDCRVDKDALMKVYREEACTSD